MAGTWKDSPEAKKNQINKKAKNHSKMQPYERHKEVNRSKGY